MRGKIITRFVYPPIPDRRFDWCAWHEGDEDDGANMLAVAGWGSTEAAALEDLKRLDEERAEALEDLERAEE